MGCATLAGQHTPYHSTRQRYARIRLCYPGAAQVRSKTASGFLSVWKRNSQQP